MLHHVLWVLPSSAQRDPFTCLPMILPFLCSGRTGCVTVHRSARSHPGDYPSNSNPDGRSLPPHNPVFVLGIVPVHSQYLAFVFANSRTGFPDHISGPANNFKFQSCLPGHLQPSRLSHYPSTNRSSDQIPTRPRSCESHTHLSADSSGYKYSAGSY